MTTADVGDGFPIGYEARDPDTRELLDATVALTLTAPDGTTTTQTPEHPSTGVYHYTITLASAGEWRWKWTVSGTLIDAASGSVLATDPAPPVYAPLSLLKKAISSDTSALSGRDDLLNQALVGASRAIDNLCGRRFYRDPVPRAVVYNPRGRVLRTDDGDLLLLPDIATLDDLDVETGRPTGSWSLVVNWEYSPDDAIANGWPITGLLASWGTWQPRVRVTARWGWPGVPDAVAQATLLQASRLYKRKDSPEGVAGSADWGLVRVPNLDPDVKALIAPYIKPGLA